MNQAINLHSAIVKTLHHTPGGSVTNRGPQDLAIDGGGIAARFWESGSSEMASLHLLAASAEVGEDEGTRAMRGPGAGQEGQRRAARGWARMGRGWKDLPVEDRHNLGGEATRNRAAAHGSSNMRRVQASGRSDVDGSRHGRWVAMLVHQSK
ncbi:hypothetical protein WJX74_000887 [Apatococcus lobatus]|uniref:Uncharacterized protein n=1 Tax=Apatococcus lobatus TaxID=904363 RepID=A0AAW1QKS2_9CHLO